MQKNKGKKIFLMVYEIVSFIFVLAVFIFSFYKIASHYGLLGKKASAAESCTDWCQNSCSCQPTPTSLPSEPTPTTAEPTPTPIEPTLTPQPPTVTPLPTATPVPQEEGGVGGPSGGGGGNGSGPASAPVCTDTQPPKPFLRELKVLGGGEMSLLWDLVEPATHYTIAYGPSSGNYLYGVDNTGKTSSFIIGGLGNGNYCFVVRGVNNCMPGEFSNERCTGQVGKVLGAAVLGATGSFDSNLLYIAFIMGTICSSIGIRLLFGSRRLV